MNKLKYQILFTILVMTIGVAAVTTNIILSGSTSIASNPDDFDVYFSNVSGSNEKVTVYARSESELKFNVDLKSSGEDGMVEFEVVNASSLYDASVSLNCNSSSQYISLDYYLVDEIIPARNSTNGFVNVTLFKAYSGDYEIVNYVSCSISATAVERTTISNNVVSGPVYPVGKEIAIGDEKFNVISDNGDTVSMLAQDVITINTEYESFSFGGVADWGTTDEPTDINIYNYDNELNYLLVDYVYELQQLTGDFSLIGDLISLKQLGELGCFVPEDYKTRYGVDTCEMSPYADWLITDYWWWTKSIRGDYENTLWVVSDIPFGRNRGNLSPFEHDSWDLDDSNIFGYHLGNKNCIRPVVTVSKDALNGRLFYFTIGGYELSAVRGMTWAEWVNSRYNTIGVYISGDVVYMNVNDGGYVSVGRDYVYSFDAIMENSSYSIVN